MLITISKRLKMATRVSSSTKLTIISTVDLIFVLSFKFASLYTNVCTNIVDLHNEFIRGLVEILHCLAPPL